MKISTVLGEKNIQYFLLNSDHLSFIIDSKTVVKLKIYQADKTLCKIYGTCFRDKLHEHVEIVLFVSYMFQTCTKQALYFGLLREYQHA